MEKIEDNIRRDQKVNQILKETGWQVLRFWGKDIKHNLNSCLESIIKNINEAKRKNKN